MTGCASLAVVTPATPAQLDWRIGCLQALMGENWLAGELVAERQLLLPVPGGRLSRVLRCVVEGCPSDRYGSDLLCLRHRRQFEASASDDLDAWMTDGDPATFTRHQGTDQPCAVVSPDGRGCPRPATGRYQLCHSHGVNWLKQRRKGRSFETLLAAAVPLPDLGPCAATCCYRAANEPINGLGVLHAQIWRAEGRPAEKAFTKWTAAVRQAVNSRVLSLRGLPELVRLELVYAMGRSAAEQVRVVTGGMRPRIDQVRAAAVHSVTEFDLGLLDGIGDKGHVRFARVAVDVVTLADADPEVERGKEVWDLRLFGRFGRKRLDFRSIRQPWLRQPAKGWSAATTDRIGDGALAHRVGSLSVFSAILAAGPGGGGDPGALGRPDIERVGVVGL